MVVIRPDMTDAEVLLRINNAIRRQRNYGRRTVTPPGRSTWRKIIWCNDSVDWYQSYYSRRGPASLDADEIAVYGISKKRLESLLGGLVTLPLYYGSFEARQAGKLDFTGIELPPAVRSIRYADVQVDPQLDSALTRKHSES